MATERGLINVKVTPVANLRVPRGGDESGNRPGTFSSKGVQDQLIANKQAGAVLRQQVGARIQNRIAFGKRADASTGSLFRASIHPRNEQVTKEFVHVGIASYLNTTAAQKYWRIFEQGTVGFIGTPLFFAFEKKQKGGDRVEREVPFPVAHGQTPGIRRGNGRGMFVVKHEIQAANIYEQVFNEFRPDMVKFGFESAVRYLTRYLAKDIVVADKG